MKKLKYFLYYYSIQPPHSNKMDCQMSNYGKCSGSVEPRDILFKYIDHLNVIPENTILLPICNLHCTHMMNWNCNQTNSGHFGTTIIATIDGGEIKAFMQKV